MQAQDCFDPTSHAMCLWALVAYVFRDSRDPAHRSRATTVHTHTHTHTHPPPPSSPNPHAPKLPRRARARAPPPHGATAPPQRRPPEVNEDITAEILLRIPPDEPADLIRASVVCKLWLHVVSDPAFLRRYSAFHRGAPLLGFFYKLDSVFSFPGFVPTTAASPPPQPGHRTLVRWVADCRYGRVLLKGIGHRCGRILVTGIGSRTYLVWDPFSNHWEKLEAPNSLPTTMQTNSLVLCGAPGCDHHSCRGGLFHVVSLGTDEFDHTIVHVHVYSSESCSWRTTSAQLDGTRNLIDLRRAALIGDGIYCTVNRGARILKYDLVEHRLSLISMPYLYENVPILMQNEDGSLGIAGVLDSTLYLCSTMVNAEGATGWIQRRVIELKEILLADVISDQANVIGFAEGVEVFFISTNVGAFTFELKSGKVAKVGKPWDYCCATPFISFFSPDHACREWTKSSLPHPN